MFFDAQLLHHCLELTVANVCNEVHIMWIKGRSAHCAHAHASCLIEPSDFIVAYMSKVYRMRDTPYAISGASLDLQKEPLSHVC